MVPSKIKTQAIIPAAGQGTRLGSPLNKSLVLLHGKPLLYYSLQAMEKCSLIDSVIVVAPKDNLTDFKRAIKKFHLSKVKKVIPGGKERVDSVHCGLKALDKNTDYVLVHDGARPLITPGLIEDVVRLCYKKKAVIVGLPVKSTIKVVDPKNLYVAKTLLRDTLWEAQTPQVFQKKLILKAHRDNQCCHPTDDAAMVEALGVKVKILRGDYKNVKITTKDDIILAEALLK